MMPDNRPNDFVHDMSEDRGFSVLEVIVAFIIITSVLITGFNTLSRGTLATVKQAQKNIAMGIAQRKIAELMTADQLVAGSMGGPAEAGLTWSAAIIEEPAFAGRGLHLRARPFMVTIKVTKGSQGIVEFTTWVIGAAS